MKNYILYNPLSGNGDGKNLADKIELEKGENVFLDLTEINDYETFFKNIEHSDKVVICGGDGTINHFINATKDLKIDNELYCLATGGGNDFFNDLEIKPSNKPLKINDYIKNLPILNVKNKDYRFINGVGYGVDGWCCEARDIKKNEKPNKKVNYTLIALKGLLFHFKPRKATVTVDGKEYKYNNVWMATTMLGRFFGGGMMIAPMQKRHNQNGTVSLILLHNLTKLKVLYIFLSVFKGKHIKYKSVVTVHQGHEISVTYDNPAPMQIDGETISDVPSYTVSAKKKVKA